MNHVIRRGKRVDVETVEAPASPQRKRVPFKVQFVKLPLRWADALRRSKSVNTYQLALIILFEAFKRKHTGGEVILSSAVTGMSRSSKMRATKELVELGLIETNQIGRQALRVSIIY